MPRLAQHNSSELRVFIRSPKKVLALKESGVEVVQGSFEDNTSVRTAVDGIDTLVLITPFSPDAFDQAHTVITELTLTF